MKLVLISMCMLRICFLSVSVSQGSYRNYNFLSPNPYKPYLISADELKKKHEIDTE